MWVWYSSVSESGDSLVIDFSFGIRWFILVRRIFTIRVVESGDYLVIDFTFNISRFILVHTVCTSWYRYRYLALNVFAPNFEHCSTKKTKHSFAHGWKQVPKLSFGRMDLTTSCIAHHNSKTILPNQSLKTLTHM